MADQAKSFKFTVTGIEGTTEFYLKHGESKEFTDIPVGTEITITEENGVYTAKTSVNGAEQRDGNSVPVTIAPDVDATVAYENNHQVAIDTGIELNPVPFVMMLSSCIVMAVFFLIGKKRMMF